MSFESEIAGVPQGSIITSRHDFTFSILSITFSIKSIFWEESSAFYLVSFLRSSRESMGVCTCTCRLVLSYVRTFIVYFNNLYIFFIYQTIYIYFLFSQ